jgi:hypothetical protein
VSVSNMSGSAGVYEDPPLTLTVGQSAPSQADTVGSLHVSTQGRKQTYSSCFWAFTPVISLNSPCVAIKGSATKTVRITRVRISWSCTTGSSVPSPISFQRYTALSGGTTNNPGSAIANDSANAAPTAVAVQYSAVPTTSTKAGGQHVTSRISWITSGASVNATPTNIDWVFGQAGGQALVLRGVNEWFGILLGSIGTNPIMDVCIEWTEE